MRFRTIDWGRVTKAVRKVVYLDQRVYSDWAKAELGIMAEPARSATLQELTEVRRLVQIGRIVCPLSLAHAGEQARWNHPEARDKATDLMLELAGGWVMRHYLDAMFDADPIEGWAPRYFPKGSVSQITIDSLRGLSPEQRLAVTFRPIAIDIRGPADAYIAEALTDLQKKHDPSFQYDPADAASPRQAWVFDLTRRRVSDPGRGAKDGDPFDLFHTLLAGLADFGVVDRSHAALVKDSNFVPGRVFRRVSDLLQEVRKPRN